MLELIIYLGLTVILLSLLSSILITILRIQKNQEAAQLLSTELNFVMNMIKTDIRQSASTTVVASSTLLTSSTIKTTIDWNTAAEPYYITRKVDSGSAERLTSQRVHVEDLEFIEFSGVNTKAIQVELTFTANKDNPQTKETRILRSTVSELGQ